MNQTEKSKNIKTFHVSISRDGKVIKEFYPKSNITIGKSLDNDIIITSWKLKDHFPIFELKSSTSCLLNVHETMEGFISKGTTSLSIKDLIALGSIPKINDYYQISIDTSQVGNIRFGNIGISVDYTVPPPIKEPFVSLKEIHALKEVVGKKMVSEEEKKYAYLLLASFLLHLAFVIFAYNAAPPKKSNIIAGLPPVIAELVDTSITAPTEVSETKGEKPGPGGGGGGGKGGPGVGPGEVMSRGVIGLITKVGGGGISVVDLLASGGAGGDLDSIMGGLGGLKTGGASTLGLGGGGGFGLGSGGGGALGDLSIDSLVGGSGTGETVKLKKEGTVNISAPSSVSGAGSTSSGRTSSAIYTVVRSHMAGIQHAYNVQLKQNPNLEGKIVVKFTISSNGLVTSASIVSSTMGCPELEQTIVSRIYTWKFPPISEGDVTVIYPFVFIRAGG
ncbi:MAG: TonB family protein [bacterium]